MIDEEFLARSRALFDTAYASQKVEGWLAADAVQMMLALLQAQWLLGVRGDIAEIGVFKGRSFVLFGHALMDGERARGIDPFQMTHYGDFESEFRANLQAHQVDMTRVSIHRGLSTDFSGADIHGFLEDPVRFFHVDGDHTYAAATHDLDLATEALNADGGIVVLDDFLHPRHADLTEGILDFVKGSRNRLGLVPFAQTSAPNAKLSGVKLFLCPAGFAGRYRTALASVAMGALRRPIELCGAQCDVYEYPIDLGLRMLNPKARLV